MVQPGSVPKPVILSFADWLDDVASRPWMSLGEPVRAVGKRDKHLGPTWQFAELEAIAAPSQGWMVETELSPEQRLEMETNGYLRAAIFGVMDVLATRADLPVLAMTLTVVRAVVDPIRSSQMAFRLAGRDLGENILRGARLVTRTSNAP